MADDFDPSAFLAGTSSKLEPAKASSGDFDPAAFLGADSDDRPEWLDKKPKAKAAPQPHSLDSLSADIAKAKAALPTTGQMFGRAVEAGATGVGDVLDAASLGAYRGLRNSAGNFIGKAVPGVADATASAQQGENAFHDELQKTTTGQLLQGTSNAIGNLAGAPEAVARSVGTGLEMAAEHGPTALRTVLASRPVAGALAGAGTNAAITAGQDAVSGASLKDTLHDAGQSAAIGGAVGGAIGVGNAAVGRIADKVNNSRGAQARRFIEENGQGATAGPLSSGKGGVFDESLAGLPANDKGIGMAAKTGASNILDTLESEHLTEHGIPYREGPGELKSATARARQEYNDARQAARDERLDVRRAVRDASRERADQITASIREQHAVETSRPYRVMKGLIDGSPEASATRDIAPIVASMQDAAHDLETAPQVRAQLNEQLAILERYRDPTTEAVMVPERQINGLRRTLMRSAKIGMSDAPGEKDAPLRAAAVAAKQMVDEGPYAALNKFYAQGAKKLENTRTSLGLKRKTGPDQAAENARVAGILRKSIDDPTLMDKFIRDHAEPVASEAPHEHALTDHDVMEAEAVPEVIDTASEPKTAQIANPNWPTTPTSPEVGPITPPGRAQIIPDEPVHATEPIPVEPFDIVDSMAATGTVPRAPGGMADLADMSDLRARQDAAAENAKAASEQRDAALYWAKARVGSAADKAAKIREMMGLNRTIGTRKADVNQARLALQRQGQNSNTGGGSPADLEALRAARPDLVPDLDLPELQRAKADLSFHLVPHHGGLIGRTVGAAAGPTAAILATAAAHGPLGLLAAPVIMAAQNATPIAGRYLYPLTKGIGATPGPSSAVVARIIQAARSGMQPAQLRKMAEDAGIDPNSLGPLAGR